MHHNFHLQGVFVATIQLHTIFTTFLRHKYLDLRHKYLELKKHATFSTIPSPSMEVVSRAQSSPQRHTMHVSNAWPTPLAWLTLAVRTRKCSKTLCLLKQKLSVDTKSSNSSIQCSSTLVMRSKTRTRNPRFSHSKPQIWHEEMNHRDGASRDREYERDAPSPTPCPGMLHLLRPSALHLCPAPATADCESVHRSCPIAVQGFTVSRCQFLDNRWMESCEGAYLQGSQSAVV